MTDTILQRCEQKGLRMTSQRKIIAQVLEDAADHPDVEELYKRASKILRSVPFWIDQDYKNQRWNKIQCLCRDR